MTSPRLNCCIEEVSHFLDPSFLTMAKSAESEPQNAYLWLRDHEPDVRLKQFFADVLKEFDSLTNESAR